MTNKQVVEAFYDKKKRCESLNVTSLGNKLLSFSTTIAERTTIKGKTVIIKNITKYSPTTSKHQYLVDKYDYVTFSNVPIGTANLSKYINYESNNS